MEQIFKEILNAFENPTPAFIVAQVIALFALVSTVVSMQLKSKRKLMILQTASEFFIVAQYFCLNAWAGALISCVSLIRNFVLTKHFGKKRAPLWLLIVLYIVLAITTSYSMFIKGEGMVALIPCVGSVIYTTALWYGETKWIRLGNATGNTPYIIYTFLSHSYIIMIMTVIEVISATIGFVRIDVVGKGRESTKIKKGTKSKNNSKKKSARK